MAKMSKAQQAAILKAHNNTNTSANSSAPFWTRGYVHASGPSLAAMERNGWIDAERGVTTAGLIEAGVDMDAIERDAYSEGRARTETSPEHRAARKADSAAYQRELQRALGLNVALMPSADPVAPALTQNPHEYPAPYAMGPTSRVAQRNQ